jgi:hypothetical protein
LKWTCTKQWRCSYLLRHEGQIFDNLKKFLPIKVIKIVLDSMLYETLKWPQIVPFCISSKTKFLVWKSNGGIIGSMVKSCCNVV